MSGGTLNPQKTFSHQLVVRASSSMEGKRTGIRRGSRALPHPSSLGCRPNPSFCHAASLDTSVKLY
jgi:hypothetical protein